MLMCKCKMSRLLWALLGTCKTRMFVLYFLSKKLIYVLHVTIQYLLIVCIEMYTFVNTYNRLYYIFDWINSVNCYSNQNPLALSQTQYKTSYISTVSFKLSLECRICLLKNVISVYVDVGECTDAIQHKDKGDFQVTGMLQYAF